MLNNASPYKPKFKSPLIFKIKNKIYISNINITLIPFNLSPLRNNYFNFKFQLHIKVHTQLI